MNYNQSKKKIMYRPSDLGWSWKRRKSRSPPAPFFFLISSRLFSGSSFFSRKPVKMVKKNLERGKEGRGGEGGDSTGKLYPSVLPLALLNTIFDRKRCSFVYLLLTKWYFFHIPSLEFCIPFNCCCVHTVFALFREYIPKTFAVFGISYNMYNMGSSMVTLHSFDLWSPLFRSDDFPC